MAMFDGARAATVAPSRHPRRNPKLSSCELHLRRVCGACVKFDGRNLRSTGRCSIEATDRPGRTSAGDCPYWSRKTAEVT